MTTGFEHISDADVPALGTLLGDDAAGMLQAALGSTGDELEATRVSQIRYTPGSSAIVRYQADVTDAAGRKARRSLVAATGVRTPDGAVVLSSGDATISVWAYPNDPFLPGLRTAADPDGVAALLARVGAASSAVKLRLRTYRPGRRAVIEAIAGRDRVFIKVVRPARVAALQRKHTAMAGALPVPHSHGWNKELGLVVLQAMPGKPMRRALEAGASALPRAEQLVALLDALPEVPESAPVRGPDDRVGFHASLLATALPDLADRIQRLADAIPSGAMSELVPVHGDFHSSQILVRRRDVIGLIDVDTAGLGDRTNDLAVLLSHLATVALTTASRTKIERYGRSLIDAFDTLVDPATLRRKVAAAIVGLATGPFRVNSPRWPEQTERRVALAERWLESAAAVE